MATRPAANRDPLHEPSLQRLPPGAPGRDAIIGAHEAALAAGEAGYVDPCSGYFVMAAATLLQRGFCCNCGCRHCPYVE